MKGKISFKTLSIVSVVLAVLCFAYMLELSKVFSYFSDNPKACINCHVMNTHYATWQHSSHARAANCLDCHADNSGVINKYIAKAIDGYNHGTAFSFDLYGDSIKISDTGAKRTQQNCINCHSELVSNVINGGDINHGKEDVGVIGARKCWECHKGIPHGEFRGFLHTPNAIDVKP